MAVIYDEEDIIKDLLAVMQADFLGSIGAINTRKADSLVLEDIPAEAWHFATLDQSVLNYRGFFIFYGFADLSASQVQEDNWQEPVVTRWEVCTFDNGERDRSETLYKLIRYRRALKDILISNPDVFRGFAKPLLKTLEPTAFPFPGSTDLIISVGLDIEASITGG